MIAEWIRTVSLPMAIFVLAVAFVLVVLWAIAHESTRWLNKKARTNRSFVDWFELGAYSWAARAWAFAHAFSSFRRRYAEVRRDVQVEVDKLTRRPVEERV